MNKQQKNVLYASAIMACWIVIDLFTDKSLIIASGQFYHKLQEMPQLILDLCLMLKDSITITQAVLLILYLNCSMKLDILLLIMFTSFCFGTNNLLKEIYNQGRPYMFDDSIYSTSCVTDLAKPSGHSMGIVVNMLAIYYAELLNFGVVQYNIAKIIIYSIIVVLIGFSRIVIGVHTIGQVVLGFAIGIYLFTVYISVFHKPCKTYLLYFIEREQNCKQRVYLTTVGLFMIFLLVSVSSDYYSKLYFRNHPAMYEQYFNAIEQCRKDNNLDPLPQDTLILQYPTINGYCFYFANVGILLGLILHQGGYQEGEFNANIALKWKIVKLNRILLFLIPQYYWILFTIDRQELDFYQYFFGKIVCCSLINGLYYTLIFPYILYLLKHGVVGDLQSFDYPSSILLEYSKIGNNDDEQPDVLL